MATRLLITGTSGLIGFRILLSALVDGHTVVATVRSKEKADLIRNNPAIQKVNAGNRLIIAVIPDMGVHGAFDSVLSGVSHVIHTGSPVPVPTFEPRSQVYQPTVSISSSLLSSALKTPTVQRVVITSSIVANLGVMPSPTVTASASTRIPPPSPMPASFANVMEAYILAKIAEVHNTEEFLRIQKPHFSLAYIMSGSNNFLMPGILGGKLPFPIHGAFVHIGDLAEVHLRVALLDPGSPAAERLPRDFGIALAEDYSTLFDHVEKAFPKAVLEGVFKRGAVSALPVNYASTGVEKLLGRELKSFGEAVVEVAGQYLENLGLEKA